MDSAASSLFGAERALIGMVHVGALPGTPRSEAGVADLAHRAAEEARRLVGSGFDAILLENMHDVPYLRRTVGPEIVAAMTRITAAVREAVAAPLGVQILAGANRAAVAVAHAAGASFVRTEGFVFASVADEGLLDEADAGPLLRYRKAIGADAVRVLADVKKKHSAHALTADVSIAETARAAAFFGADAVVVTGRVTADPVAPDDLEQVRAAVDVPVVVGSGTTPQNLAAVLTRADAVIVGSWYKRDGTWSNPPDPDRVARIVAARDAAARVTMAAPASAPERASDHAR